jgi:diguanylate cyclase (GGDEF)-like protein
VKDVLPSLSRAIGLSGKALDTLMPMHLWVDPAGQVLRAGPTITKMVGEDDLTGKDLFSLLEIRRPVMAGSMEDLLDESGNRLTLALRAAPSLHLRGTVARLPDGAGALLDISLGLSFARAVAEFGLTLNDFSPCDQTVELLYLHEANQSTAKLSRHLSERLERARATAEAQALSDALTGLANWRAMDLELERCLADRRLDFAVLHIDLDLFKQVNDTFGHAAGDRVLSRVGEVLRSELRKTDIAGRVGGDEFLVLLHDCVDPHDLSRVAARLIEQLEVPIPFEGQMCQISASIGIATVIGPHERPSVDALLADTDMALYQAKRSGRGRYVAHGACAVDWPEGRRAADPAASKSGDQSGPRRATLVAVPKTAP